METRLSSTFSGSCAVLTKDGKIESENCTSSHHYICETGNMLKLINILNCYFL